jgi:protein ImuA
VSNSALSGAFSGAAGRQGGASDAVQADGPLVEVLPARPGDAAAALGFALAWAERACPVGLIVWAMPDMVMAEEGAPYAEGIAQYGLSLDRLLIVRTKTQGEALWAAEQALKLPHALALVTIAPSRKTLSLTVTRRLLLLAEKHGARCVLLHLGAVSASAAWLRWRIGAAPSCGGENRELGMPAFTAELVRNRAGPAGFTTILHWNAHARVFAALDGALAAAPADRSAEARRQSA